MSGGNTHKRRPNHKGSGTTRTSLHTARHAAWHKQTQATRTQLKLGFKPDQRNFANNGSCAYNKAGEKARTNLQAAETRRLDLERLLFGILATRKSCATIGISPVCGLSPVWLDLVGIRPSSPRPCPHTQTPPPL